jgi:hypothetical protein
MRVFIPQTLQSMKPSPQQLGSISRFFSCRTSETNQQTTMLNAPVHETPLTAVSIAAAASKVTESSILYISEDCQVSISFATIADVPPTTMMCAFFKTL